MSYENEPLRKFPDEPFFNQVESLQIENAGLARELTDTQLRLNKYDSDLAFAGRIQQSTFPGELVRHGNSEFIGGIKPAADVGGDFFDFVPVSQEEIYTVVGDVRDKGLPAAIIGAAAHGMFHVLSLENLPPEEIMTKINTAMLMTFQKKTSDSYDRPWITALISRLNLNNGHLDIVRAGNAYPVVLNGLGQEKYIECGDSRPLNVEKNVQLNLIPLDLDHEDTVILYTDGVTDTTGSQGKPLGLNRLISVVSTNISLPLADLYKTIWHSVAEHQGEEALVDDSTLALIRYSPV